MDEAKKREIVAECQAVLMAFGRYLDTGEGRAAGELFADDGVWNRQGNRLVGPAAVQAAVDAKPVGRISRHLFTNMMIIPSDDTHAEGWTYYMVFTGQAKAGDADPLLPLTGPERVGDYITKFKRTERGWRISYNGAKRLFAK